MKQFVTPLAVLFFSLSQMMGGEARLLIIPPEGTERVVVANDGQLSFIDRNFQQHEGVQNSDGHFEVVIPLTTPQYFLLRRNYLFLSPGDDLIIHLDLNPLRTEIEGVGAEVNRYLKQRFFIRAGSFLNGGDPNVLRPTLEETLVVLDSLVKARQRDLAELDADETFKTQENIRIKADFVNSLFYFPMYARHIFGGLSGEERTQKIQEFHTQIRGRVQPLLDEMSVDPRFLNIDVVRFVMQQFSTIEGYTVTSRRFHELFAVADRSRRMTGTMPQEQFSEYLAFGETIQCEEVRNVFLTILQRHSRFASGAPAIDVNVVNLDGLEKLLSDHKGKVMYVDIWATWCGPCRREKPFFRALSREFENIHFIAISVDENVATWNNFMHTQTDRAQVTDLWAQSALRQEWDIVAIPRFLLIDENFRIITTDAPRPSDTERIRALLNKHNEK